MINNHSNLNLSIFDYSINIYYKELLCLNENTQMCMPGGWGKLHE